MGAIIVGPGILGVASFLPIWRGAGHSRHDGVSFLRLIKSIPAVNCSLWLTPTAGKLNLVYCAYVNKSAPLVS